MVNIATWNINGIKARHHNLIKWLKNEKPDIVALQEIKCVNEKFPKDEIENLGYNIQIHGQKSFNGVAVLSLMPIEEVNRGLDGDKNDEQARFMEVVVPFNKTIIRIAAIYLPNGNPTHEENQNISQKYKYKIKWMERLKKWTEKQLKLEEPLMIIGDFNVIPNNNDCWDHKIWENDALATKEVKEKFREIKNLGMIDAIEASTNQEHAYTFWDFQKGAWQKNHGIRIDHMLLSPECAKYLESAKIHKQTRAWEKPSDHVPVTINLKNK